MIAIHRPFLVLARQFFKIEINAIAQREQITPLKTKDKLPRASTPNEQWS
jgi:hypothetical protein